MTMTEKTYRTASGIIHYWISEILPERKTLVFLPGLTADHHLFDRQTEAFEKEFNLFVWDAPGHGMSRPFQLDFTLMDKAQWLYEILQTEKIAHPVLIGQSMGGYVSQCFMEKYPGTAEGFVSIDSAPLKRCYVTAAEIIMLKKTGPMFRLFPWNMLKKIGADGCSETEYGRSLMRQFIDSYSKEEYIRLADHGYRMLGEAMAADLPYEAGCPVLLICGRKDNAGSAKSYNRRWAAKENLPLVWIENAGHNSNTDQPQEVNRQIRDFVHTLSR